MASSHSRSAGYCSRAPGTDESWARVDRKMLWSPAASSDRQRRRVLARVKARRYAPPPLRGAGNLDAGAAHALRLAPCLTMPNHDPYMLWSTTCPVSVSPKRPLTYCPGRLGGRSHLRRHPHQTRAAAPYASPDDPWLLRLPPRSRFSLRRTGRRSRRLRLGAGARLAEEGRAYGLLDLGRQPPVLLLDDVPLGLGLRPTSARERPESTCVTTSRTPHPSSCVHCTGARVPFDVRTVQLALGSRALLGIAGIAGIALLHFQQELVGSGSLPAG